MTRNTSRPQSRQCRPAMAGYFTLLITFAFVLCGTLPALAQQITGTLVGTVKDSQGALIPSAQVKAINVETGFSRSANADAEGNYRIQYLPVGRYRAEVSAPGFKTFVQENVVLSVDQTQTVNVMLNVGAENETVMVTTAPPLVETDTAELGRTVQPAEITGLPLINRDAYSEMSLTPGVQSNSAGGNTPNFVAGVPSQVAVVNGGIDEGVPMVSYYLDGGINEMGIRNYGNPLPTPDAIQEFRVETSNFSAQYGRMSGAVVTAVTRSGTNRFHGSLFEFNRNTAVNATPWNSTFNAPYHRNQFGGTVGGPVRKDKAFFFFSYGGLRQVTGTLLTGAVVPTDLERVGDFTQSAKIPNMPGTSTPVNGTNSSANCQTAKVGCVPSTLLDPTAKNLMSKYIPVANTSGLVNGKTVQNQWKGYFTGPLDNNEFLGKYDQVLSANDHLSASYFTIQNTQGAFGGGSFPYSVNQSAARQQNVNISDVHTFGATTANQTWVTFTRVAGGRVNLPQVSLGDLGSDFTIQGDKGLPQLSVSGYFTAGQALAGPVTDTDFYSIRDVVSMTRGKHSLNFGAELSLEKDMLVGNLDNFGVFTFSTSAPTTTGNALADFVTGQVASMEQDTPYHGLMNNWYPAFFIQDNFHFLPRLVLDLGLRYDLQTPPTESSDLMQTFVPLVQSTVVPSAPKGLLYPGDSGVTRGITGVRAHHISPRVGISWDPFGDGKTAIRAGAGVFYGSVSANEWNQPANAQPFAVRQTFSSITSLTHPYTNKASFPNGDPFPYTFNPKSPRFLPAAGVEAIAENYQWPLTYQINMAIERQLPFQTSLTAAYVGTLAHDIPFMTDANYPAYAPGASTSQTSINNRRPYDPGVLGQTVLVESNQTASYHSLQISARRPLTRNLLLNGYYVFSKTFWSAEGEGVGFGGNTQDYDALWEERGPGDYDRTHMASISGIWNINYYEGSHFLLKEVLNGWTIAPIITMNSGAPVNIRTGTDKNLDGIASDRPNLVPGVSAFLDPHRDRSVSRTKWFNPAAFTSNGPGLGIGIGGADGNTPINYLRAPGYRNVDLGVTREIAFERGITLQVRGAASNVFNMVSLGAPTANLASTINGQITSAQSSPRLIQIGMRLVF